LALAARVPRLRSTVELAAAAGVVLVALAAFAAGYGLYFALLVAAGVFGVVTYTWPAAGIAAVIFLSTDGLKFFSLEKLPYLQLGPGLRLNAGDLAVLFLLGIGLLRLLARRELPRFTPQILLLAAAAVVSTVYGIFRGTVDIGVAFNGLRVFSGYLFYVGLVGLIDTPAKLRTLIRVVFALVVVTVAVQVAEAALGERIVTPYSPESEYFSSTKYLPNVSGTVPYLWNRAVGYLLVGLFMALGAWLWSRRPLAGIVAGLATLGFLIALVRQWYVFIGIGVILLFMSGGRTRASGAMRLGLAALLAVVAAVVASAWMPPTFPLAEALQERSASILNFQSDHSVVARLAVWHGQLETFYSSPIAGVGPGTVHSAFSSRASGWATDIGMTNTLVEYGVLGLGAILFLVASVWRTARDLVKRMPDSPGREYAAAAMCVWIAMVIAYTFTQNFFTSTELAFATGLVMAVVDRLAFLSARR
jgi:hypothetical protein